MKFRQDYYLVADTYIGIKSYDNKLEPQDNGCIHYTGAKHNQGYGLVSVVKKSTMKRKMMTAHRVSMTKKLGRELHVQEKVMHTCYNNQCVNPDHLFIGDNDDKHKHNMKKK